jgi:uncharacterized protein YuzE
MVYGGSLAATRALPILLKFPTEHFWVDYDREADVLCISFRRPQKPTDTRVTNEGLLLRYHGEEPVGITILEAPALRGFQHFRESRGPLPCQPSLSATPRLAAANS